MRKYLAVPLMLLMLGCAALNAPKVSPEEQIKVNLAQGYILLSQVRLMAADAVRQKLLNVDEGKRALELTDTARKTLDSARDSYFGGVPGADVKGYQIAEVILTTLRNDIESKITQRKEKAPK